MKSIMLKLLRLSAAIYACYLLLAILLVLPALNFLVPHYVKQYTGRTLHNELIIFNPFTLSLTFHNTALYDPDGDLLLGFDKASVNLSLASLWQGHPVLDQVQLLALAVHIKKLSEQQIDDSTVIRYNFSDIEQTLAAQLASASDDASSGVTINRENSTTNTTATTATHPTTETALPAISIHRIDFSAKRISYSEPNREQPFATHFAGIKVQLKDFSTINHQGQPYQFVAAGEAGGKLSWRGTLSLPAGQSQGHLELSDISLVSGWRFLSPLLNLTTDSALLNINGDYRIDWSGEQLSYQIDHAKVLLHQLKLRAKQDADSQLSLDQLALNEISINSQQQSVELSEVVIDGLNIQGWSEGERLSLVEMFAFDGAAADDDNSAEQASPWQLQVGQLQLINSHIQWRNDLLAVEQLSLVPTLTMQNLHWPAPETAQLNFAVTINQQTTLSAKGDWLPATGSAQLSGELSQLALNWLTPLLPQSVDAVINDGQLNLQWQASLEDYTPTQLIIDGNVGQFAGHRRASKQAFLRWGDLQWQNLAIDLAQQQVNLEHVLLSEFAGRLLIFEDGSTNLQRLLGEESEASSTTLQQGPKNSAADNQDWGIAIGRIDIDNSRLAFQDNSLPKNFQANINQLGGFISGISSDPKQQATIDLTGSVDGYAPVTITGTMQPLIEQPALDMALSFRGIDLTRFTPYSGTYAGYAIDKGLLSLTLNYQLEAQQLMGSNKIVIDQLTLGDHVDSELAVSLPLQLAIALLSDQNGVIDLGVDISGDVEDPDFHLGGVIWQACRNIIVKAVTAPFRLLANLIGSDDELEFIELPQGLAQLDDSARNKLSLLADTIAQRPQLKLGIIGAYDQSLDTLALQQQYLRDELLKLGLSESNIANQDERWVQELDKLHQSRFPELDNSETTAEQQALALSLLQEVKPQALLSLANARALEVKRYLVVELKAPADKIFIEQSAGTEAVILAGVKMTIDV